MRQTQKEKLLPEQTAEKIRGYIEGNGLKVGDKLPNEFQLAEICGVGRSTVRGSDQASGFFRKSRSDPWKRHLY